MNSMYGAQAYGGPTGPKTGTNATGSYNDKLPKGIKTGQLQNFTPEMMELFQSLFGQLGPDSQLAKLASGDQSAFADIEAPAMRQFNELQGGLASRFSGQGSLGSRRSSGFQNTSSAAASNFAQDLQSQRHNITRQALQDLFSHSNMLLGQEPYDRFAYEKPEKGPSKWGGLTGAAVGAGAGYFAGNPILGAQIGYGIGKNF